MYTAISKSLEDYLKKDFLDERKYKAIEKETTVTEDQKTEILSKLD